MDLWSRLDDVQARWNVLEHPFYDALGRRRALARRSRALRRPVPPRRRGARRGGRARRGRRRTRVGARRARRRGGRARALWDDFAGAAGTDGPQEAEPETAACADAWAGDGRDLLGHLVALYAIESAQPAISRVKADGLREHYGFAAGPATAYFDLHTERDVEHAAEGRELIEARLDGADEDALVAEAERVLRANWALLDGVERLCAPSGLRTFIPSPQRFPRYGVDSSVNTSWRVPLA